MKSRWLELTQQKHLQINKDLMVIDPKSFQLAVDSYSRKSQTKPAKSPGEKRIVKKRGVSETININNR